MNAWRDTCAERELRLVQLTPRGSAGPIHLGTDLGERRPAIQQLAAPSRIRMRLLPETQKPMWWYSHSSVRAMDLIDALQRHPG